MITVYTTKVNNKVLKIYYKIKLKFVALIRSTLKVLACKIKMSDAKIYHENNKFQIHQAEEFLSKTKEKLQEIFQDKECKTLDIGTGDGKALVEVFMEQSGLELSKVVGTDKNERMIIFASENYGNEKVCFEVFDVEDEIPEGVAAKGPYDLVTSFSCFHFVQNLEKAFENIKSLLNTDGAFFFVFPYLGNIKENFEEIVESFPDHKEKILEGFSVIFKNETFNEDFSNLLGDSGFSLDLYECCSIEREWKREHFVGKKFI